MDKIVVGLDNSERARLVLDRAVRLARTQPAQLVVIRAAWIPVEFPMEALSLEPTALPTQLVEATQRQLDALITGAGVPGELLARVEARLGTPWQVLCEAAREFAADLVVIGTHGYGAIDRLVGTTAARVVNHAPCSVLVVRAPAH